jgi:hypothetical protein
MWKMMMATKGKVVGLVVLAFLPVFIIGGAWMFVEGLQSGKMRQVVIGLLCLIFFGGGTLLVGPSKKYVPGKTFQAYRNKKFHTQKAVYYGYAIIAFICLIFAVLVPEDTLRSVGYAIAAVFGLYTYSKTLKFNADIDFSTNEYLATALGFPVGEKILVSYQNFEAGEVEAGSNAFAATATKLVVASFDGDNWIKLSRDLNQVSHIGITGDESQNYFFKLQFLDGADVLLRIELYEKLTSNPVLVIKKLLEAIDASLLGEGVAPQAAQRRRVVVNHGTPTPTSKNVAPESTLASVPSVRSIEVTPDVLTAIQAAAEVAPGRRLEL